MKNRIFFNWLIILMGVIAITSFCFTPSFADDLADDIEIYDESFGENDQVTWLGAYDFVPNNSTTVYTSASYFQKYITAGSHELMAVIHLPSGARLFAARLYAIDISSSANAILQIWENIWPNTANLIAQVATSGTPGFTDDALAMFDVTIKNGDRTYNAMVYLDDAAGVNLRFFGVKLYWYRQISPAPANATFNDVGPGHWAFQSVEALAASGITKGCPDGPNLFCPDKPVSRAAMAAFLARALGLHWDVNDGY